MIKETNTDFNPNTLLLVLVSSQPVPFLCVFNMYLQATHSAFCPVLLCFVQFCVKYFLIHIGTRSELTFIFRYRNYCSDLGQREEKNIRQNHLGLWIPPMGRILIEIGIIASISPLARILLTLSPWLVWCDITVEQVKWNLLELPPSQRKRIAPNISIPRGRGWPEVMAFWGWIRFKGNGLHHVFS